MKMRSFILLRIVGSRWKSRISLTGFTLIELLIVIVIIGILSTLAVTHYGSYREKVFGREASANLRLIAAAERIYRMENSTYYPASGTESGVSNINSNLKVSLTETDWDYSLDGGTDDFTAYAYRQGSGGYLDCVYTLAHNDADGEPNPNTSCP